MDENSLKAEWKSRMSALRSISGKDIRK
jgi:hypothetical protein